MKRKIYAITEEEILSFLREKGKQIYLAENE
jgi:hypothetical protein